MEEDAHENCAWSEESFLPAAEKSSSNRILSLGETTIQRLSF